MLHCDMQRDKCKIDDATRKNIDILSITDSLKKHFPFYLNEMLVIN